MPNSMSENHLIKIGYNDVSVMYFNIENFSNVLNWCKQNIEGDYLCSGNKIWFREKDDELMFRLAWL
jgi:hypothetical protein